MPQVSERLTSLTAGGSDGWELFYEARGMVARGIEVTELTIGEHDIRTDPSILDAMHRSALGGHTGYASVPGTPSLRAAVAARLTDRSGVPTRAENIFITPGGQSALFASHVAACPPGGTALFVDPFYATYPGTVRGAGGVAKPVTALPEDGFQPRREAIEAAATGASSLLINTPNNPTGVVYHRQTLEGISKACVDHDLWLISDEVYDTQVWEGAHVSPRALPGMAERTLVVGSMSKSHAMTGSRIGWVAGPEEAIAHMINLATHTTYGVPGFVQDAALFALEQGHELEAKVAAPFLRRRQITLDVLARQNVVRAVPAQGAMYVMLDIRAAGVSDTEFAQILLREDKIAVMPGVSFGSAAAGHIRVAMTVGDDAYARALEQICLRASILCAGAKVR